MIIDQSNENEVLIIDSMKTSADSRHDSVAESKIDETEMNTDYLGLYLGV